MSIFTKLLGVLAGALFVAWMVFTFLGLDSDLRPTTMPMMSAGEICLSTSLVLFLIRFTCLKSQKQHKDV